MQSSQAPAAAHALCRALLWQALPLCCARQRAAHSRPAHPPVHPAAAGRQEKEMGMLTACCSFKSAEPSQKQQNQSIHEQARLCRPEGLPYRTCARTCSRQLPASPGAATMPGLLPARKSSPTCSKADKSTHSCQWSNGCPHSQSHVLPSLHAPKPTARILPLCCT